jgi:hypothetical protein
MLIMDTDEIIHLKRQTILGYLNREYTALRARLDRLTEADALRPGVVGYWSAHDLVAHLIYWNRYPVDELKAVQRGEEFVFPFADTDEANEAAVDAAEDTPWPVLLAEFEQTYQAVRDTITALPEVEFTSDSTLLDGLGNSIAGAFGNNTWEHYELHREDLDEWMKAEDLLS